MVSRLPGETELISKIAVNHLIRPGEVAKEEIIVTILKIGRH